MPLRPPFPGDWRPTAPTTAQVLAHHRAAGGQWWVWLQGGPPVIDALTLDSFDGVNSSRSGHWDAREWARGEWPGVGTLTCPCDANGAPVPWPGDDGATPIADPRSGR